MKLPFTIAALALMLGVSFAETRTFTQKETGKTVTGELKWANMKDGSVTVRMDNGQVVTFKQAMLSDDDREFIIQWAKDNAYSSDIRLSATKVTGERTTSSNTIYQTKSQENGYKVSVRNASTSVEMEGLTLRYTLVYESGGGQTATKTGTNTIARIAPGDSEEITTDMITLGVSQKSLSSCPKCVQAAAAFKGDKLEGVYIIVEKDGKQVTDFVAPSSKEKQIREAVGQK